MALRIDILTLFPEMFAPVLGTSIPKRAAEKGLVEYHLTNIRDFATDNHKSVDDKPFGGGPGMVMMCQVLFDAVEKVEARMTRPARRIMLTPQGRPLTQAMAEELAAEQRLLLIAGHYEGFDERIIEGLKPMELSIGDYVLSGGELAAMVVVDAVVRLLPGPWAPRTARLTRRSRMGCWSIRSTPGRGSFAAWRCRTCCCRATTRRSPSGGTSSGSCERSSAGRTCGRSICSGIRKPWSRRRRRSGGSRLWNLRFETGLRFD